jgi:phosphatidylinositol 4-kinase A
LIVSKAAPLIVSKIIRNMDSEKSTFYKKLDSFFERVTSISGILKPQQSKPEKREIIARELAKIEVSPDIYMPPNPRFQLVSIKLDSGAPMQSAAKCPILVSFFCRKYEGPDKYFEKKMKKEMTKQLVTVLD